MGCTTCQILKAAARPTKQNPFGGRNVFTKRGMTPLRRSTVRFGARRANVSQCATSSPWPARAVTG